MKLDRTPDPMHPREIASPVSENYSCTEIASGVAQPACGAKTRSGAPCRNLPMKNGRCRMHGGMSTGPRTEMGILRWRAAVTVHGGRSREMMEFRRQMRRLQADARRLIEMA